MLAVVDIIENMQYVVITHVIIRSRRSWTFVLAVIDCFLYFHLNDYSQKIGDKLQFSLTVYYFSVEYCILHCIAPQQGRVVPSLYT